MLRLAMAVVVSAAGLWAQVPQTGPAKELNDMLDEAGKASGRGDNATAIRVLEAALIKVQKDPSLKGHDIDVLRGLGHVYSAANQFPNAVRSYKAMVDEMGATCGLGKSKAELCADIYYDLGTAQMQSGDFAGAAVTLGKGVPIYDAIQRGPARGDYKMAKLKLGANTNSMLGAALFRSGNLEGGIAAYQRAVQQYNTVIKNPESGDGLQALARGSLRDAQESLNLLLNEQKVRAAQKEEAKKAAPKK
jgi:tetratricopeptide (TPR) repeat protein